MSRLLQALIFVMAILSPSGSHAQEDSPQNALRVKPASAPSDPKPIQDRAGDRSLPADQKVSLARRAEQETETPPQAVPVAPAKQSRSAKLDKEIKLVQGQQNAVLQVQKELRASQEEFNAKLDSLRSGELEPDSNFSFLDLDRLRDELSAEQQREESLKASLLAAEQALAQAQEKKRLKDRNQSRAKEALDVSKDKAASTNLTIEFQLAQKEASLAAESGKLKTVELEREKLSLSVYRLRIAYLQQWVQKFSSRINITKNDLARQNEIFDQEETDLRYRVETFDREYKDLELTWTERINESESSDPLLAKEATETLRLIRQTNQEETATLNQMLSRVTQNRQAWQRRYEVIVEHPGSIQLGEWQQEGDEHLDRLRSEARLQMLREDNLRSELAKIENRLQAAKDQPFEIQQELESQRQQLQRRDRNYDHDLVSIEASRRLHEKLLAEIRLDVEDLSALERLALIWAQVVKVWNYPLFTTNETPITFGKVFSGIILLFMGFVMSRFLSRIFGKRILPKMGMNESAAAPLQSLAFYVLVMTFTMLSLRLVNVPLTMFTFLGGALAIGIGFGSQSILNNFISGLIILAERPVRKGDLIELDGLYGTVSQIGPRSTRITTTRNLEIIVPNSSFLENNVINWTLSNHKIRAMVQIGVSYGSPTREVSRLLKKAAEEHGRILKHPEPFVWFVNFGDNSLSFELHFWIEMRTISERLRVESDIRFKIDSLFREANIVIAFPQRDVHLDLVRPLDVRVLRSPEDDSDKLDAA